MPATILKCNEYDFLISDVIHLDNHTRDNHRHHEASIALIAHEKK